MDPLLNQLMQLVAANPNDASLGKAVRDLVRRKLNEGSNPGKQLLQG
jgi:hypothetical protein|tara:strand:+ start:414 stop:554 length:141 start_codon:yes stop_codon:yes gene_type:complete